MERLIVNRASARPARHGSRRRRAVQWGAVLIAAFLLVPATASFSSRPTFAQQDVLRIAAVVNDDVISIFDLAVRLAIAIRSSGFDDTPQLRRQLAPQMLRAMVDERLQAQEVQRMSTAASEDEVKAAVAKIEQQNGWEKHSFESRVSGAGLDRGVILDQIRTEIGWGKIVRRRFATTIAVSEDEIDAAAARIEANRGKPENRVAEIFLPVDEPDQEAAVRGTAADLVEQLRNGGSFAAVARQFSKGVTSSQGGEVGWVVAGQLADEVEREVAALSPGQVSEPIRTFDGYYIVTLTERRLALSGTAGDPTFRLAQVVIDSTPGDALASQALINDLRATRECASFLAAASGRASPLSGKLGAIALSDMPDDLRAAIQSLQAGQTTPALAYDDSRRVIMVCERSEPEVASQSVDRDAVRRDLGTRMLELAARRYLRDLRRAAFIDVRI